MNKKNNRKGFTTVELVIVIAVIAILASVLIPTFANLIDKANESSALQEARNTLTSYTTENALTFSGETIYIVVNPGANNQEVFKVENGKLNKEPLTEAEADALDCGDLQIRKAIDTDPDDAKLKGYVDITPAHTYDNAQDTTCNVCG